MFRIELYDSIKDISILAIPRHCTFRKVPNEDYCFSFRVFAVTKHDIVKLKEYALKVNRDERGV